MKSAREKLSQSIQRDIFFDFKQSVIFLIILGILFFISALGNLFFRSQIINIVLFVLAIFGLLVTYRIIFKFKIAQREYEQKWKTLLNKIENK